MDERQPGEQTGIQHEEPPEGQAPGQGLNFANWLVLLIVLGAIAWFAGPQAAISLLGEPATAMHELEYEVEIRSNLFTGSESEGDFTFYYNYLVDGEEYRGQYTARAEPESLELTVYYLPSHPWISSADDGFPWWRTGIFLVIVLILALDVRRRLA